MAMSAVLRPPPSPASGNSTGTSAFVVTPEHREGAPVVPIHRLARMPTSKSERALRDMFQQMKGSISSTATEGVVLAASGSLGAPSGWEYEKVLQQITPPGYTGQVKTEGVVQYDTVDHDGRPLTLELDRRVDQRFLLRESGHSHVVGHHHLYDRVHNSKYAIPVGAPKVIRDHKFPTTVASFKGVTWVGYTHMENPDAWRRARGKAIRAEKKRERTRRRLGLRESTSQDFVFGRGAYRRPPDPLWFCRNPDGKSMFFEDEKPWPLGFVANATDDDALWGKIARLKTSAMKQFKASPFVYDAKVTYSITGTRCYEQVRRLHPDLQAQFDSIEAEVLKNEAGADLPWSYPTPPDDLPSQDEGVSSDDCPSWEVGEDLVSEAVALGIIDWDEVPNPYEMSEQAIQDWGADLAFKVQSKRYANQVRGAGSTPTHSDKASGDASPASADLSVAQSSGRREATVVQAEPEEADPVAARVREIIRVPSGLVGAVRKGEIEVLTRNSFHRIRGKDEDPLLLAGEDVIDLPPTHWRVLSPEEAANHPDFSAVFKEPPAIESMVPLLPAPQDHCDEPIHDEGPHLPMRGAKALAVRAAFEHLSRVEREVRQRVEDRLELRRLMFSDAADPECETLVRRVHQRHHRYRLIAMARGKWHLPRSGDHNPLAPKQQVPADEEFERILNMDVGQALVGLMRRARKMFSSEPKRISSADALRMRRAFGILPHRGFLRMVENFRKDSPDVELHARFPLGPHKPCIRTQLEVALARYSGTGVARKTGTNRKPPHLLSENASRLTDEELERRLLEVTTPIIAPPDWQLQLERANNMRALVAERSLALSNHLDPVEVRHHSRMVMPFIASVRPFSPNTDTPPSKGQLKRGPHGEIVM